MSHRHLANLTPDDWAKIDAIFERARSVMKLDTDDPDELEWRWKNIRVSFLVCHREHCPLDLDKLMAFDDFSLCHDIGGIDLHMCRDTLRLKNHFLPRSAAPQGAGSELAREGAPA